jgi:hypothetical protein
MSIMLSIDYPAISAEKGNAIKDELQRQDILGDFGPGLGILSTLLGKKKPDMTWCNIIEPNWFEGNYDGSTDRVPLTEEGMNKLNTAVQAIYNVASGPITVLCHRHNENPKGQKELNIQEFNTILHAEGLPYRTLIVLDRRLADRSD